MTRGLLRTRTAQATSFWHQRNAARRRMEIERNPFWHLTSSGIRSSKHNLGYARAHKSAVELLGTLFRIFRLTIMRRVAPCLDSIQFVPDQLMFRICLQPCLLHPSSQTLLLCLRTTGSRSGTTERSNHKRRRTTTFHNVQSLGQGAFAHVLTLKNEFKLMSMTCKLAGTVHCEK